MHSSPSFVSYLSKRSSREAAALIARVNILAMEAVMLALVETLSEKEAVKLTVLVESGDEEKIAAFLDGQIPDMGAFVDAALADLRDTLGEMADAS